MKKTLLLLLASVFIIPTVISQEYLARARKDKEWGCIDTKGTWVVNPQFEHIKDFSEGLAAVRKGGEWGFIDKTGSFIVNPQFEDVENFSEGLAAIKKNKALPKLIIDRSVVKC